ncbi:acyltransferase [Flavobacterium sp. ST-75]|uniref:Acyltransferase n=1 Tax=Flavobacterium rhizophilum TaxID=3163296 RepID=A0ABW8YAK8_9FLAO
MSRKKIKKIISKFSFIPLIKKSLLRGYFDLGFETYIVNSFFQKILRFNTNFLLHFTSRAIISKKIIIEEHSESITVYRSFATSGSCYYQAMNGIEIGKGTIWAYGCKILSANHSLEKGKLEEHDIHNIPIKIGQYVWLGAGVIVLSKVKIGNYAVIGAGSVVTKDIPDYAIAVGNPAKIVGYRCERCLLRNDSSHSCLN